MYMYVHIIVLATYKLDAESTSVPIDPATRGLRPTIDPADELTMKNRFLVSRNLIGQFKSNYIYTYIVF